MQHHLIGIAGRFLENMFTPLFIRCLRPLSWKASRVEPEWRRSLETGSQPPDRTPLGTAAAAIVSEWVTDRLRWKQLSSCSPVYSPSDSCTCTDTIIAGKSLRVRVSVCGSHAAEKKHGLRTSHTHTHTHIWRPSCGESSPRMRAVSSRDGTEGWQSDRCRSRLAEGLATPSH